MARIRSIHPRIYTDENFVSLSMAARVLLPALWTEAFDDGVFEWKPLTLKMRLFPADALDLAQLLEELKTAGWIRQFEALGKTYGAIRNFQKWQRPKKPKHSGVLPANLTAYVGAGAETPTEDALGDDPASVAPEPVEHQSGTSSEPVGNLFGTGGESCSQKGGREEGRKEEQSSLRSDCAATPPARPAGIQSSTGDDPPDARSLLWSVGRPLVQRMTGKSEDQARKLVGKWLKLLDDDCAVLGQIIIEAADAKPIDPAGWISATVLTRAAPSQKGARPGISLGDRPEAWEGIADSFEVDRITGKKHPICGLSRADVVLEKVIEAAGMPWDWRGDVSPLARWLRDIGPDADVIVPKAVRDRAAWRNYEAPAALAFFDKAVIGARPAAAAA